MGNEEREYVMACRPRRQVYLDEFEELLRRGETQEDLIDRYGFKAPQSLRNLSQKYPSIKKLLDTYRPRSTPKVANVEVNYAELALLIARGHNKTELAEWLGLSGPKMFSALMNYDQAVKRLWDGRPIGSRHVKKGGR